MKQIVIISGKGGTGKTSLSAALATMGEPLTVADCDVDAANLHLLLQPSDQSRQSFSTGAKAVIDQQLCTQCGACMDACRFDAIRYQDDRYTISETSCDGCRLCMRICPPDAISMVERNGSYWASGTFRNGWMVHARLAPGEENSGKLVNVVREQSRLLSEERGMETILIDGPPGTGCPAISAMSGVDLALLITEPSHSGFHDLKRVKQLTDGFGIPSVVVINKYDLNEQVSNEIGAWCRSEHLPLIGRIPFEPAVVEAMLQCRTVVEWAPRSVAAREIAAIHRQIFKS
ncbi:MAG TPA: (4Fe-4S)-binding protein [Porphyromonadaceae bacterium]|jgi:MinD superfamily P-loop ATPase|nr:(4Fe-4S)-binding protein [Porphyromonadaceae bacterium]